MTKDKHFSTSHRNFASGAFTDAYKNDDGNILLHAKDSQFKYDYLLKLGLVTEPIEEWKNGYSFVVVNLPKAVEYKYNPDKEKTDVNEEYKFLQNKAELMRKAFDQYRHDYQIKTKYSVSMEQAKIYAITKLYANRHLFPYFMELIETLYEYRLLLKDWNFDMHGGNWRACPITNKTFCYDPVASWSFIQ